MNRKGIVSSLKPYAQYVCRTFILDFYVVRLVGNDSVSHYFVQHQMTRSNQFLTGTVGASMSLIYWLTILGVRY